MNSSPEVSAGPATDVLIPERPEEQPQSESKQIERDGNPVMQMRRQFANLGLPPDLLNR